MTDIWSQHDMDSFVAVLASSGDFARAAASVGRTVEAARAKKKRDPQFSFACDEAIQQLAYIVMPYALLHATVGVPELVLTKDGPIKDPDDPSGSGYLTQLKSSDAMRALLLKGLMKQHFGDGKVEQAPETEEQKRKALKERIAENLKQLEERHKPPE